MKNKKKIIDHTPCKTCKDKDICRGSDKDPKIQQNYWCVELLEGKNKNG